MIESAAIKTILFEDAPTPRGHQWELVKKEGDPNLPTDFTVTHAVWRAADSKGREFIARAICAFHGESPEGGGWERRADELAAGAHASRDWDAPKALEISHD